MRYVFQGGSNTSPGFAMCTPTTRKQYIRYRWFAEFRDEDRFEKINHAQIMLDRERVGRQASPTGAIIGASIKELAGRYDLDPKTVTKWPPGMWDQHD